MALFSAGQSLIQNRAVALFLFLISLDCLIIGLHLSNTFMGQPYQAFLNIEREGGLSELFQYLKYFLGSILSLAIAAKTRTPGYLAWALLLAYFLADDAIALHEMMGTCLADQMQFEMPLGLRHQDLGEVISAIVTAAVLCGPLVWAYTASGMANRQNFHHLVFWVVMLGCFGVLIDFVHMMVQSGWKLKYMLAMLEDGGEMIAASGLLAQLCVIWLTCGTMNAELTSHKT